jgi:hypothetical protein
MAASITSEDQQGRIAAMALNTGGTIPAAVEALIKMDVFEAFASARINDGAQLSMTTQEIANLAMPGKSINVAYLERLLRILASHKVFSELGGALY